MALSVNGVGTWLQADEVRGLATRGELTTMAKRFVGVPFLLITNRPDGGDQPPDGWRTGCTL